MRLLFIINTPGQAHTWKYVIRELISRGHQVRIAARDYGSTPVILEACGFRFDTFQPVGSRYTRLLGALHHLLICNRLCRDFDPSLVVGFGADAAVAAARSRKPSVIFNDDDHTIYQNRVTGFLASVVVTPDCFNGSMGRRHIRVNGYKELAYLHPNYFKPDISIFDDMKLPRGEKYVILRFNSFDAIHDINAHGFSAPHQLSLVAALEKHARVFISPEGKLPEELEPYRLQIPYERFHHALAYAHMFVADTGTSATEAAMLGTPAIFCYHSSAYMGNFVDLVGYGLLYYCDSPELAIQRAVEMAQQPDLKRTWKARRQRMLCEKADVGRFMIDLIESYTNNPALVHGERRLLQRA